MFNKAQNIIEEQKPNNSTETAILPMPCYAFALFLLLIFSVLETIVKINKNTLKKVCSFQNKLYICISN